MDRTPAATVVADTAQPPRVSLIVATVDRTRELERLLASLARQGMRSFEVIIVDQNDDERLAPVIAAFAAALRLVCLRSDRGLSRSRNSGLARAQGSIIGFPDDDAAYDDSTLQRVVAFFDRHPGAGGLSGRAVAYPLERPPARFARHARWVNTSSVWVCGMSCTIFLRREVLRRIGGFDERLGLGAGTAWQAGEEADLLLRAVKSGAQVRYEPSLPVRHPGHRGAFTHATRQRGLSYGRGMGFVMRSHGMSRARFAYHLLRPAAGGLLAALAGRFDRAGFHLAVMSGRWRGWHDARSEPPPAPHRRT